MSTPRPFPVAGHDHRECVRGAVVGAEQYCRAHHLRLTPLRRRVLELIWSDHQPVGAYTLLERLGSEGRRPAPPTIYRALEFCWRTG